MAPWQPNKTFRRKFVQSQKEFGFVLTCVARVAVSVVDEMEIETTVGRAFSPNLFTIRMAVGPGHPPPPLDNVVQMEMMMHVDI